jgi:hypothetical protein
MAGAALGLMGAGTVMSVGGQLSQGSEEQAIANQRAQVDIINARYAKENALESAKITSEQGKKLIETQKAGFAASGVRMNVGAPLVVEAQTTADIYKDIGFTLQRGEQAYKMGISEAGMEKAQGRVAKQQSIWGATGSGLSGAGSIAYLGYKAGY